MELIINKSSYIIDNFIDELRFNDEEDFTEMIRIDASNAKVEYEQLKDDFSEIKEDDEIVVELDEETTETFTGYLPHRITRRITGSGVTVRMELVK